MKNTNSSQTAPSSVRPHLLYITVFVCGTVIMIMEMLGFRILAPFYGYSIYVWGNLIGLIMAALSVGYYLGGRLSEKYPAPEFLFRIILAASIYVGIMLFIYKNVMKMTQGLSLLQGSCVSTIIIFGPSMILLSIVVPFVIKLLSQYCTAGAGGISGRVYAVSTAGSLAGTFAGAFFLIPETGSHNTMIVCFALLLITSTWGLSANSRKSLMFFVALPLPYLFHPAPGKNIIYEEDSRYFNIKVAKDGNVYTYIRDDTAIASQYVEGRILTGDYWDFANLGPILGNVKNILVLGMGTGTTTRQYMNFFPNAAIDAVEIDPSVVKIAKRYFAIKDDPRLHIHIADVRPYLDRDEKKYDFIEIDVFRRPREIPFYLTTREFFSCVHAHLRPGGIIFMNVLAEPNTLFVKRLLNTVCSAFPSCYTIRYNAHMLVIATRDATTVEQLNKKLAENNITDLNRVAKWTQENIFPYKQDPSAKILTDDLSPIEQLTYSALQENK